MNTAYNKVAKVRQIYEKVILILNRTKKEKKRKKPHTNNFETFVCEIKSTPMFSRKISKIKLLVSKQNYYVRLFDQLLHG